MVSEDVALVSVERVLAVHPDVLALAVAGLPARAAEPARVPLHRGPAALARNRHRRRVQPPDGRCGAKEAERYLFCYVQQLPVRWSEFTRQFLFKNLREVGQTVELISAA